MIFILDILRLTFPIPSLLVTLWLNACPNPFWSCFGFPPIPITFWLTPLLQLLLRAHGIHGERFQHRTAYAGFNVAPKIT